MEKLKKLSEIIKPGYVVEFESQVSRFTPVIIPGDEQKKILEIKDNGLLLFHQGPEKRIIPGFPAKEVPTGRESVFLEFSHPEDSFHLVGKVDKSKRFTLLRLERYQPVKGYCRVGMSEYQGVIESITKLLREIKPPQSEESIRSF